MSDDIDREILLAVLAGESSELERRLLQARRLADPRFDEEVKKIEWIWSVSERDVGILRASSPPTPESIIASAELPDSPEDRSPADAPRGARWVIGSVAASIVVAIGLGVVTFEWLGERQFAPRVVMTGMDEVVTVALEDGTSVRMAPNSRLEFGRGGGRNVALTGRAFFAVAHREGEPFRVQLPERTITVLGTRFDVEARDGQTRVAVVEGEVRISGSGPELTAFRDQVAYGSDAGTLVIQRVEDIYQTVDWLGGFVAFESTPLGEVAEEIRNRFGFRVAIADSGLAARTVTGWFTNQSHEGMISAICTAVGARCVIEGQDIQMTLADGASAGSNVRDR